MKKGYVCQKDYIIKNLTYFYFKNYPNNCIFIFSLIRKIMEDIEIYDNSSQILFSESIGELAKKFSVNNNDYNNDHSKELTIILKHFMIAISTLEKSISDEYINQFNNLIETFCNNKFTIILDKELTEYAISLGKFGQSVQNKKFSVYFCVCLIRISKIKDEELYNKIFFLAEDTERDVKFEMAYHIRFIIYLNDSKFCQDKITNFLNYYLEDCDMNFLDIIIESILFSNNLLKFNEQKSFKDNLKNKIEEIINSTDFSTLSYDFHIISNIFLCILNFTYDNGKGNKNLYNLIKHYLKNYFYVTELQLSTNVIVKFKIDYILKVFDKILYIFSREKDIQFLNEIFPIAMKYYFQNKENIDIFYEILHLIILKCPNEFLNKNFFNNIFFFLEEENIDSNTISYNNNIQTLSEINTTSNSMKDNNSLIINSQNNIKEYKEYWFNNFDIIMQRMIETENDKFFKSFFERFNSFLDIINKSKEWRICIKLFKTLQMLPKYIMLNHLKYPNYEDYFKILVNFCKELLKDNRNILIENEITLLLCQIIQFSKTRNKILDYLKENFLLNKSFYRRRIYCLFGDSAYLIFSKEFIKEKNIYSNLFQHILVNDILLMKSYIINIIIKYELYDNEIVNIVKNIINTSIKNDNLLNESINNYLKLSSNKIQKNYNNEKEKLDIENKVSEIEKIQKEKEKKSNNLIKKSIRPKHKKSGNVFLSNKKNKLSAKLLQKIDDKNIFSNTTKIQDNKNCHSEHNILCNTHFPKIRKTSSNCCFNSINKTPKNSSHKKI